MTAETVKHEIIFTGRSNVGKSSIIRALTGKMVRVGKRPGVTLRPNYIELNDLLITDLPGFGYMSHISKRRQEEIKDFIVQYIEKNAARIVLAIHVIDGSTAVEIIERWKKRDEIPVDLEIYEFLQDLKMTTILAVNKLDKIKFEEQEKRMNEIAGLFDMLPPWRQWSGEIAPVSAKLGEVEDLKRLIRKKLGNKVKINFK